MVDLNYSLKLCSYYCAAEAFDQGKDIFAGFIPIIESIFRLHPDKNSFSFLELKALLNDYYGANIPTETMRQLLQKLNTAGKVDFPDKQRVRVNPEFYTNEYFLHRTGVENEINDLFLSFREYLLSQNIKLSLAQVKELICNYIYTHSSDLAEFFGNEKKANDPYKSASEEYSVELLEFLLSIKQDNLRMYNAFIKLYQGSVQASLLNFTPSTIDGIKEKFSIKNLLLDSNYIMRLLNLQTEVEKDLAVDTFLNLKTLDVNIHVLEQTLVEIRSNIKRFLSNTESYTPQNREFFANQDIPTNGIWSAYQEGRVTRTSLLELANKEKLIKHLAGLGIDIISDIDMPDFETGEIESIIKAKNRYSYDFPQAKHDLLLIDYCRSHRPKKMTNFYDATWWVLTSDIRLTYWNYNNSGDIHECITEAQISNLLWLSTAKDDNIGLINTMVTLSTSKLLDFSDIDKFNRKMQSYNERYKDDPQSIDHIAIVYASNQITPYDILKEYENDSQFDEMIQEKAAAINADIQRDKEAAKLLQSEKQDLTITIGEQEANLSCLKQEHQRQQEISSSLQIKADTLESQVNHMKNELKITSLDKEIQHSLIELDNMKSRLNFLSRLNCFLDNESKSVTKRTLIKFILVYVAFVAIIAGFAIFLLPLLGGLIQTFATNHAEVFVMICTALAALLNIIGLFVVPIVFFGKRMSMKDFFDSVVSQQLSRKVKVFADNAGQLLPDEPIEKLTMVMRVIDNNIKAKENSVAQLQEEKQNIELEIKFKRVSA